MSTGLLTLAGNDVQSVWPEMGQASPWPIVECGTFYAINRKKSDINWERDDESMVLQGLRALIAMFTFFVMV